MASIALAASKVLSGNAMFMKSPYDGQLEIRTIRIKHGLDSKKSMILLMIRMQVHLYKVTLFTQTCQRNELLKSNNPFYN